jgi:hypothetical protein
MRYLTKSIQRGYGLDLLRSDPDLQNLRDLELLGTFEDFASLILDAEK